MQSHVNFEDTRLLIVVIEHKASIDDVLIDGEAVIRSHILVEHFGFDWCSIAPVDRHRVSIQDARVGKVAGQRHRLVRRDHLPWDLRAVVE